MTRLRRTAAVLAVATVALIGGHPGVGHAAAGKRVHGLYQFQSPSGNIGCELEKKYARCDIRSKNWTSPPRPSNCDLDYGDGLFVAAHGKGNFICAGDTALNDGPKLHYGKTVRDGRMSCKSKVTGITCRNRHTGHGFAISKESYRRF